MLFHWVLATGTLSLFDHLSICNLFHLVREFFCAATESNPTKAASLSWSDFLNRWQTLIAGGAAFVPAAIAAVFMWKQLNEQRAQFFRLTEQRAQKARLRLSRNLSDISDHLDSSYKQLLEECFVLEKHAVPERLLEDIFDAGITSGANNFHFIKEYVSRMQQYASRCKMHKEKKTSEGLKQLYIDLAILDIMTDSLYPFARFEKNSIERPLIDLNLVRRYLAHDLKRSNEIRGRFVSQLIHGGLLTEADIEISLSAPP